MGELIEKLGGFAGTNPCADIVMPKGMMCAGISWKQDPGGAQFACCSAVVSYDISDDAAARERYIVHAIHSHKEGSRDVPPSGANIAFLQQVLNIIKEGGAPDKFCKDGLSYAVACWVSTDGTACTAHVYYQNAAGPLPLKLVHIHSMTVGGVEHQPAPADRDFLEMMLNDPKIVELK